MSNHISVKFLGLVYASIPKQTFDEKLPSLIDSLRYLLPRHDINSVNEIRVNVGDGSVDTQSEVQSKVLNMVDAEGLWAIKVGDAGVSLSSSEYVSYENAIDYMELVLGIVVDVLNVTHFSSVVLRNINLFNEIQGAPNSFEDIKIGRAHV